MTYSVSTSSGSQTFQIFDGVLNSDTDLSLPGKGTTAYGTALNTNFIRLLENFAGTNAPGKPVVGELWFDTRSGQNVLRVFNGSDYVLVGNSTALINSSQIGNVIISASGGHSYISENIFNGNLNFVANGSGVINSANMNIQNLSPGKIPYISANGMILTNGTAGALAYTLASDTITVTNLNATNIAGALTTAAQGAITSVGTLTSLAVGGTVTASTVNAGTIGNTGAIIVGTHNGPLNGPFNGTIGATTPNTIVATSVTTTSGGQLTGYHTGPIGANTANTGAFTTVTTTGNVGIGTASPSSLLTLSKTTNSGTFRTELRIENQDQRATLASYYESGVAQRTILRSEAISGGTAIPIAFEIGSTERIRIDNSGNLLPGTTNTQTLGSTTLKWANIYGNATSALYADLAECYVADFNYAPGTVVEFGGANEITIAKENSKRVAGVISTNPGYLMNSDAKGEHVLPLALQGRVPTKVIGPVNKGDMMVSAGNGFAMVNHVPSMGTVIGKALQSLADDVGVIEVVVGRL